MEQQNGLAKLKISGDTPLPTRVEGELNVARAEWTLAQAALEKTASARRSTGPCCRWTLVKASWQRRRPIPHCSCSAMFRLFACAPSSKSSISRECVSARM